MPRKRKANPRGPWTAEEIARNERVAQIRVQQDRARGVSAMKATTVSQSTRDYPRTPDGKYKYTTWDGQPLHFEPATTPELIGPDFPIPPAVAKFFRKLFRRTGA